MTCRPILTLIVRATDDRVLPLVLNPARNIISATPRMQMSVLISIPLYLRLNCKDTNMTNIQSYHCWIISLVCRRNIYLLFFKIAEANHCGKQQSLVNLLLKIHRNQDQANSTSMSTKNVPLRKLGQNGPLVPALGLCLMGMSTLYGPVPSDEERFAVLDRAVELGATNWDSSEYKIPISLLVLHHWPLVVCTAIVKSF